MRATESAAGPAAASPRPGRPSAANERCATRADLRGDPMIGTAFPAARLLLVEQPGAWGRRGLRDSRFPADAADALERRAAAAGLRVQVIRRPGRDTAGGPRAWGIADTRPGRRATSWGSWSEPAELLDLPLDGSAGRASTRPGYLVCSHAKHDVCCALRGRPVAEALQAVRSGDVWETSHLGGDRFGANVLALPSGMLYGRVLPFAVTDLADATDRGEMLVPLLRGRIGLAPAAQVALAHAAAELGLSRVDDLDVLGTESAGQGRFHVRLRSPEGIVGVTVDSDRVAADGLTCSNPRPGAYIAYRAAGLRRSE